MVTNSGWVKPSAVCSASGSRVSAKKPQDCAAIPVLARSACPPIRFVFSVPMPSPERQRIASSTGSAKTLRKTISSTTGMVDREVLHQHPHAGEQRMRRQHADGAALDVMA